ncbi:MAG: hypothetical protein Tsb0021_03020 [Chlamydiales bacterium]
MVNNNTNISQINFNDKTNSKEHKKNRLKLEDFGFDLENIIEKVEDIKSVINRNNAEAPSENYEYYAKVREVLQSEIAFTIASDPKPILATYGCLSCVAVAGYDETNQFSFLTHLTLPAEVIDVTTKLFSHIDKLMVKKPEKPLKIYLRGGDSSTEKTTLLAVKTLIT